MFTEVGKLAADVAEKPFQDFIFLIRDYEHSDEFGFVEGQKMLNQIDSESALIQNKERTPNVKDVFETFRSFCLPYPGSVVKKEKFDGDLHKCEEDFIDAIKDLMDDIFKNLKPKKKMNGEIMSLKEVEGHFRAYAEIFAKDDAPKTGNIIEVSAMCHYQTQVSGAKRDIDKIMEENFIIEEMQSFEEMHDKAELCTKIFNEKTKERKFMNPHVYAVKFYDESAKILGEKLKEAKINFELKHSKDISEKEKMELVKEKEKMIQERKERDRRFQEQIDANRAKLEEEKETTRKAQEENKKIYDEMVRKQEQHHKDTLAQQKSHQEKLDQIERDRNAKQEIENKRREKEKKELEAKLKKEAEERSKVVEAQKAREEKTNKILEKLMEENNRLQKRGFWARVFNTDG